MADDDIVKKKKDSDDIFRFLRVLGYEKQSVVQFFLLLSIYIIKNIRDSDNSVTIPFLGTFSEKKFTFSKEFLREFSLEDTEESIYVSKLLKSIEKQYGK